MNTDSYISSLCAIILLLLFAAYFIRTLIYGKLTHNRSTEGMSNKSIVLFIIEAIGWAGFNSHKILSRYNISPDFVSTLSFITAVISGLIFSQGWFGLGAVFFLLSGILDLMDGHLARHTNTCSKSGDLLDSVADRYGENFILLGLLYYYRNFFPVTSIIFLALVGSVMVTYISVRGEMVGVKFRWNIFRRPGRIIIFVLGGFAASFSISFFEKQASLGYPMIVSLLIIAIGTNIEAIKNFLSMYKILLAKKD